MQIYERIFEILQQKGMSQKELSEKTGIGQSTISDWKNKRMNPSSDKIMIICDALGVSPYAILSGSNDRYNQMDYIIIDKNSDENTLIEIYRNSSKDIKNKLLGYAQAVADNQK